MTNPALEQQTKITKSVSVVFTIIIIVVVVVVIFIILEYIIFVVAKEDRHT